MFAKFATVVGYVASLIVLLLCVVYVVMCVNVVVCFDMCVIV